MSEEFISDEEFRTDVEQARRLAGRDRPHLQVVASDDSGLNDGNRFEKHWPEMRPEAYRGLAGEVVAALKPHTESDPNAILLQTLACSGNVIGRGPYYQVEGDRHGTNLYVLLVGRSSKARKGTSAGRVRQIARVVDDDWERHRITGGCSSGEGLISAVQDRDDNDDPLLHDKRLLVFEPEYANVLTVARREGNTLSRVIRDAWDQPNLVSLTKNPMRATGALVSIIGHITDRELRSELDRTSMANGFANRNLIVCVKRSQLLPHGGALETAEVERLGARIREAVEAARKVTRMVMTDPAKAYWEKIYPELSSDRVGLFGAIVGRAEAQTIRLALLYALLEKQQQIDIQHLESARAVWDYCEASARYVFGDAIGDPVADEILRALRGAGDEGLSRTQISELFKRHRSAVQLGQALITLEECGLAKSRKISTSGRSAEKWIAC